jgi:tellurite resistance protein TehA-like permease
METPPQFRPRIGTFFLLVGFVLLVLFLASGFSQQPEFVYLLLALACLLAGFLFRRKVQRPSSGRFNIVRRALERSRMRREEKKK